jgi:hypothetical protein
MKKTGLLSLLFFMLMLAAVNVQAQEDNYTVENVFTLLESNFSNYPWAHIYYNRKIPDSGRYYIKLGRYLYDGGEVVLLNMVRNGWRYEVKVNFAGQKEVFAKRSKDIKNSLYTSIADLLPG